MKTIEFNKTGNPLEVLELTDKEMPEPGDEDVLVKVLTCNINLSDIAFVNGMYGIRPEFPSGAGFEASGIVQKAGKDSKIPVGTKVAFTEIGVWSEYVKTSYKSVIPLPSELDDKVACQVFVNPVTAYGMLEESGLKENDWLLLTAAASAFGKFAVQLCRERGIKTICTVRHDEQKDMLKELGAVEVINSEKESIPRTVFRITEGRGANGAFDAVGGELGAKALNSLSPGSTMFVYGLLSYQEIPLNSGLLIFKDLMVRGFWLTTWMQALSPEKRQQSINFLLSKLKHGELEAPVEATYPLEDYKKAIEHSESSGRNGKVIFELK
jgi:NADPH:quinone reductase-like Zn-dependent oxidoreductase